MDNPTPDTILKRLGMQSWAKLDLLVLTFNAGKAFIDSGIFADRLEGALTSRLPDVVVFSLQEVSPLSRAFIGGPLLNPYLARYEEALNTAAVRIQSTASTPSSGPGPDEFDSTTPADEAAQVQTGLLAWKRQKPYTLVRQHNVGMTAIMLFARHPRAISELEIAEVGFGIRDMGNKGAVGLRMIYDMDAVAKKPGNILSAQDGDQPDAVPRRTQLTFAAAHLAPMEWNLQRRNQNWQSICSGLLFDDPVAVIKRIAKPEDDISIIHRTPTGRIADSAASPPTTAQEEEEARLLLEEAERQHSSLAKHIQDALVDITIYRPGTHFFFAGDLNYRISEKSPKPDEPLPSLDPESPHHWSHFLHRDQLHQERMEGRALHHLDEPEVDFPPTYKYDVQSSPAGATNEVEAREAAENGEAHRVVPFKFATHRWPSWTDRILYFALPPVTAKAVFGIADKTFDVQKYTSLPLLPSSDHQPVFMRVLVPMLSPSELGRPDGYATPRSAEDEGTDGDRDLGRPLPFPVDIHARARRTVARRGEVAIGLNLLLVSSKEGVVAITSFIALALGSYWLYNSL